jgi:putative Mn2+ efflux pump MntP
MLNQTEAILALQTDVNVLKAQIEASQDVNRLFFVIVFGLVTFITVAFGIFLYQTSRRLKTTEKRLASLESTLSAALRQQPEQP